MPKFSDKTIKTSSDSKRHFTVVMGNKEHGLYVSSTPSSAARKAATKLCSSNKSKKVEFHIREITQGSKKKVYGPYIGYIEKLKESIELKGRVIKYKPIAKLKKGGQRGGGEISTSSRNNYIETGNYDELFNKIFGGSEPFFDTFTDIRNNSNGSKMKYNDRIIMDMLNWALQNKPLSDKANYKYYFILIYWARIYWTSINNSLPTSLPLLIDRIGLDNLIEIIYRTDYGNQFDNITIDSFYIFQRIRKLLNGRDFIEKTKKEIFDRLLAVSQIDINKFKEILIILFSLDNLDFMDNFDFMDELFRYFSLKYEYNLHGKRESKLPGFKFFTFLLENKHQLKSFIKLLKKYFIDSPENSIGNGALKSAIRRNNKDRMDSIFGTAEEQQELFKNL
jgi:hypothetical protein